MRLAFLSRKPITILFIVGYSVAGLVAAWIGFLTASNLAEYFPMIALLALLMWFIEPRRSNG